MTLNGNCFLNYTTCLERGLSLKPLNPPTHLITLMINRLQTLSLIWISKIWMTQLKQRRFKPGLSSCQLNSQLSRTSNDSIILARFTIFLHNFLDWFWDNLLMHFWEMGWVRVWCSGENFEVRWVDNLCFEVRTVKSFCRIQKLFSEMF